MTSKFRCLIVDDEPAAHYVLENYIRRLDHLELAGQCYNVTEAINFLHRNPVDLIFLDINMPELSGFDLLRTLKHPPKVILTTAYSEFALESYEYGAMDYLLKPIDFPRFLKSTERFITAMQPLKHAVEPPVPEPAPDSVIVKVDTGMVRVHFDDLLYTQSMGNYVKLFTPAQVFIASITTGELEQRLPAGRFMRIHKSYIASLEKISKTGQQSVFIGTQELPVGITYRRELAERLK